MKHLRKFDSIELFNNTKKHIAKPWVALVSSTDIFSKSAKFEYEYVDLGLPSGTLWCTVNVGAKEETEYGNYYSWGEIETKNAYVDSTYSLWEEDESYI